MQPYGPYVLGGYSGGGLVAYEMARQLVAAGERVDDALAATRTVIRISVLADRGPPGGCGGNGSIT